LRLDVDDGNRDLARIAGQFRSALESDSGRQPWKARWKATVPHPSEG
jgi:hypothetical protein